VLLLLLYEVVMMLGIAVMAMPGLVPLGLELLMQPTFAFVKFFLVTLLTFLLRSLATFLLSQWAADVDVSERELARRQQRFISLLRVTHRLINVAGLVLVGIWVLLDIPGVRSVSNSLILAGGALLGALAFVFQGFLRDFVTGLVMLLEDRYAIGDWIEVDGIQGEVVDVGLFSTQIRCLDQRINIVDNSSILQMRNATKLRSGSLITFLISHRQSDLAVVFSTLSDVIETFKDDPIWGDRLIGEPILRGVKRISALGVHMQVLLITRAGEQWATEREFQRLALKELHSRNVEMANGLELAVTEPDDPRRMEG
jgi:small conductance mechanosensitive channel